MALGGKQKISLLAGLILLIALPVAIFVSQQVQNIAPRAAVITIPQSYLSLVPSTTTPAPGQEFTVDLVLDTTKDPDFVVTGVDAIIRYCPPQSTDPAADAFPCSIPKTITPGTAFESLTKQDIDSAGGLINLSAANASVKNSDGTPAGFTGNATIATITFTASPIATKQPPISLLYTEGATDDTNIIGFQAGTAVDQQSPRERLLTPPSEIIITTTTTTAVCGNNICEDNEYVPCPQDAKCIWAGSCPEDCEPTSGIKSTPPPTPAPISTSLPCPAAAPPYCPNGTLVPQGTDAQGCTIPPLCVTTSSPTPTPTPQPVTFNIQLTLQGRTDNHTVTGTLYAIPASTIQPATQVQGVNTAQFIKVSEGVGELRIAPSPYTFLPDASATTVIDYIPEDVYKKLTSLSPVTQLATFTTNPQGVATITVPERFLTDSSGYYLIVNTVSHLSKKLDPAFQVSGSGTFGDPYVRFDLIANRFTAPPTIKFTDLVPGDIFVAEGQSTQDSLINTFDATELLKHLGFSNLGEEPISEVNPPHKADLNADGVVNTLDLRILLNNLNQRGFPPAPPTSQVGTFAPTKQLSCSSGKLDSQLDAIYGNNPTSITYQKATIVFTPGKTSLSQTYSGINITATYANYTDSDIMTNMLCAISQDPNVSIIQTQQQAQLTTPGGDALIAPLTFDECMAMDGHSVQEIYPRICITPDGRKVQEGLVRGAKTCSDSRPVCGSDGSNYPNQCAAEAKGLYWTRGVCQ